MDPQVSRLAHSVTTGQKDLWFSDFPHYNKFIILIRMSFIARYVYIYDEFVFVTEASTVQQNDSDRTKTQIINKNKKYNRQFCMYRYIMCKFEM